MFRLAVLSLALLSLAYAQVSTIYWPIFSPTPANPWVIGQKNILAWNSGGGTGIESFDIQLHNSNRSIMTGFIPIALRVPMEKMKGSSIYGGEIEVDIEAANIPTGAGFRMIFLNTYHGQVYAHSDQFSILAAAPANYSSVSGLPTATVTATITTIPNPTQQYAVTLNGIDPDATASTTNLAGQAGSGT